MTFPTAAEMAAHLRQLVDDEEFVTRTVRVHFPEYKREVRAAQKQVRRLMGEAKQRASVKADPDSYVYCDISERQFATMMRMGSESYLRALWAHHGRILHHLSQKYPTQVVKA